MFKFDPNQSYMMPAHFGHKIINISINDLKMLTPHEGKEPRHEHRRR